MTGDALVPALVAAVLVFWAVGAHNRLVGLRNDLVRSFVPVEQQFRARQVLLQRLVDAGRAHGEAAAQAAETLHNACVQAEGACQRARQRPGASGAITSLRLADEIVVEARQRLPAEALAEPAIASLVTEITAADSAYAFARRQFNDAVGAYNEAIRQFPTWLIAGLFRFRRAGTL